ncbi:hypothetical protein SUGI_0524970 [Cryptomeria japonica]|uniref:potassium transporter 5 n=1 Tax=Cryptomeria japonica TaxID=3369 RepID=UPI002408CBC1|nr:potassium transporter 5 [Cryptomeria japonica]GLJ26860.1 hypothetical protein SUGI_0524970 [Cryptomeria japonica]
MSSTEEAVVEESGEREFVDGDEGTVRAEEEASHSRLKERRFSRLDSLDVEANTVPGMGHAQMLSMAAVVQLAFQSIGVVYGDIGTSPLYVYASTFPNGIHHPDDVLGALSLIIYSLTLFPLIKYVFIVLWANDNGDGGTFALYSLICRHAKVSMIPNHQEEDRKLSSYKLEVASRQPNRSMKIKEALEQSKVAKTCLLVLALVGTCMVIGDGVLTPCISVLSAVGGIKRVDKSLDQDVVVMISVIILVLLFSVQSFGTNKVGCMFAPAILLWFLLVGSIGIFNLAKHETAVLRAFNPMYIIDYFKRNSKQGWLSLGGIVLCITGTEAMFADLGHFSVRSIQIAFTGVVYPSLICAYVGQAAYLRKFPENVSDTFYKSIPDPLYIPVFVVAILSSIIASQAMISATFTIIKQSMSMGCFPRVTVVHTSPKYEGQVYIPEINYILMIACVVVTVSFKDTTNIGNAYGIAVVAVMIVTSAFLGLIMLMIWQTQLLVVGAYVVVFGSIELIFFSAVLWKFTEGGYLPLTFAAALLFVMCVWHYVHARRYAYEMEQKMSADYVTSLSRRVGVSRVEGMGLLYTELAQGVPAIFSHFITNLPALHSVVVFVCFKFLPVNTVPAEERFLFRRVGDRESRMYRCIVRYGYTDTRTGSSLEFENLLVESLKEFIQSESWWVDTKISEEDEHSSKESAKEELAFVDKSRAAGVVYLLGHSEVRASKDSSLFKRFVVNYAYDFLKRNSRQMTAALEIPNKNLLQVGMTYYI